MAELTRADYERMGIKLATELYRIRARAKRLAFDDMERWRLSLRASEITAELKVLTDKARRHETV